MSFYKKVDNIIVDLKDINKMYFSLHNRNKILVRERKYESKYNDGGADDGAGGAAGAGGASGADAGAAGAGGADAGAGAVDMPPAGLSGENRNNHHRYWVRSLRSRFY